MAHTYDMDGSVTDSISERQEKKKKKNTIAMGEKYFGVPKDVRDASKRLYGPGPFDVNDQRKVIDYYKKAKKKKGGGGTA